MANAIFLYRNCAYLSPKAKPPFPAKEYPSQLFLTSLNLNQALISFFCNLFWAF